MLTQDFPEQYGGLTNPYAIFQVWWDDAYRSGLKDPNAFALATVDALGHPHARIVLAKEIRPEIGLVFYTNFQSDKGQEMAANPNVAATFFWDPLHRQVRFQGQVVKLSRKESESYWDSRARSRQLAQITSQQSQPVASRAQMDAEHDIVEAQYAGKPVPCPAHWGGYLIQVQTIELWNGHPDRFHDRYRFTKVQDGWTAQRLYP